MSDTRTEDATPAKPPEPTPDAKEGAHKVDEAAQEEAAEERKEVGGYQ